MRKLREADRMLDAGSQIPEAAKVFGFRADLPPLATAVSGDEGRRCEACKGAWARENQSLKRIVAKKQAKRAICPSSSSHTRASVRGISWIEVGSRGCQRETG